MLPSSLILTGRRTSRAPRNSQSTWAPVPSSDTRVSPGEVVVLQMGAVAAPIRIPHKAFNPGRAREHEILPVVPMVLFTWERPALKMLMSLVNSVANSRKMTIIDGKTMFLC